MKWTREQSQVIDLRDRNLLVSAAAGSGKTAVLVERIVKRITDENNPIDIDRLLVMTFTNAAAAQMRDRIGAAIDKELEKNPDNLHLQRQATLVLTANITTIDSFCLQIIREYFNQLDIDPAFRIGDDGELLLLQKEVLEELFEEWYEEKDSGYLQFVEAFASGKGDYGIEDYIKQLYQFSQSNPWPDKWLEDCEREALHEGDVFQDGSGWMEFLLLDCKAQAKEWALQLAEAALICQEENGPQAYLPTIEQECRAIEKLLTVSDYEELLQVSKAIVFDRLAAVRSKEVDPDKKEAVSSVRARVKKGVEKLKELYISESVETAISDMAFTGTYISVLLHLVRGYTKRLQEKKREKNLVDFNDLEHFALEILLRREGDEYVPTQVADELSERFEEILVDEYQDSNLVQEALITSVSRERFQKPNVFMVGDVKQSIYKFRLARPELFLEKYHRYTETDSPHQKIELHQNFRSRPEVLESINQIFYRVMGESLGGIQYTEKTALHPGASFQPMEDGEVTPTELWLVNTDAECFKDLDEDVADYTTKEIEARLIADRIKALTDPGEGLLVWDDQEASYRRARYSDIVILLRSVSGFSETFIEVLARQGIPAFAESKTGYFTTIEVETVLSFLSVIDNPIQDIPLTAVLRSPMISVSDSQLAVMTAEYKNQPDKGQDRGIYGAMNHYLSQPCAADEDLYQKLGTMKKLIEEFQYQMTYLSLHELIYQVYDRTGYYDYVSAMPAGETRQANLDMLVEKAAVYEATSYKGLFHFIRYIENLKKYKTDFGEASTLGENDNTVRIVSIHKSKGLEFPIVILAGMAKGFNKQDVRGKILIDPDLGIAMDYMNPETRIKTDTLKKNVLKRRTDLENLGEELRVLYVAMTRAKEKLIMTAADKTMETRKEKWSQITLEGEKVPFTILSSAGSYLDWIFMSLSKPIPSIAVIEKQVSELLDEEMDSQLKKRGLKEAFRNLSKDQIFHQELHDKLEVIGNYRYPYEKDIGLHTKTAVSELKQRGQMIDEGETAFLPTIPLFLQDKKEEGKGAYKGTAYHRAMELLPFHLLNTHWEVTSAMDRLMGEGRLSKECRELVDDAMIARFLDSNLGKRMKEAQADGRLHKEQQFVIGIPASSLNHSDTEELVLIQGIIDAYFEEEGSLVLVDYKTDRIAPGGEHILKERYESQLSYYGRALEQMVKMPVKEKIIYSYHLGEINV